jgi:hypothetical protein
MKLTHLTDDSLDQKIQGLVQSEREILTEIIHHLREIEYRRLFSSFGFSSLFSYTVKRLGYSEDQAHRRISAMRLLKELPAIEEKISSGELTLTNLSNAQTLFRQEEKAHVARTTDEKLELLEKLTHSTTREAEKLLEQESFIHQKLKPELDLEESGFIDMHFPADKDLQEKLKRLMALKGNSENELAKLIHLMAEQCLSKWDPLEKAKRREKAERLAKNNDAPVPAAPKVNLPKVNLPKVNAGKLNSGNELEESIDADRTRYIPAMIRHAVYLRDGGKCRNCGAFEAVEIDHLTPYAQGGKHDIDNLRLLCRSCNQRHAIETYGQEKMGNFLRSPFAEYLN